ncbi:hypothetical protein PPTG_14979 [Phytophthora nicotianae INRA-310]|uniref:Expansin-like EG45 domain-containing protein n=1 Tax=Phytophthora nicotianae (strain INRA-310) TaxID=761204 RepID=W2PTN5_PHYN3|nr:hypothetical protein PPTG_14979 [Phytophthora nicotianae INRA-310]ETN04282.1 hypothetical protein PPTG_14979 [Phytophthora nicotianae INRA-310]
MRATQLLLRVLALLCLCSTWFVFAKEVFTGKATTYGLESALGGSCSSRMAPYGLNSSLFVAMNYDQYYESSSCSRCLSITGESGTVTAFVADLCYECGYGNLDLNTGVVVHCCRWRPSHFRDFVAFHALSRRAGEVLLEGRQQPAVVRLTGAKLPRRH